eukprot:scaffold15088_cov20-Tisochrysis_lutea.AAC.6
MKGRLFRGWVEAIASSCVHQPLWCLEKELDNTDMSKECKAEVEAVMSVQAKDFRLDTRLKGACEQDINALCAHVCNAAPGQVCGGSVLHCLQIEAWEAYARHSLGLEYTRFCEIKHRIRAWPTQEVNLAQAAPSGNKARRYKTNLYTHTVLS